VIQTLAEMADRSRSQIARMLVARGLAAFQRDGNLTEPIEITAESEADVYRKLIDLINTGLFIPETRDRLIDRTNAGDDVELVRANVKIISPTE
jgi:hypothetical protein